MLDHIQSHLGHMLPLGHRFDKLVVYSLAMEKRDKGHTAGRKSHGGVGRLRCVSGGNVGWVRERLSSVEERRVAATFLYLKANKIFWEKSQKVECLNEIECPNSISCKRMPIWGC